MESKEQLKCVSTSFVFLHLELVLTSIVAVRNKAYQPPERVARYIVHCLFSDPVPSHVIVDYFMFKLLLTIASTIPYSWIGICFALD